MQKAESADAKNEVICLIVFTPRVIVIKMSKMAHFSVFSADDSKKISQSLGKIFKCTWKILLNSFKKMIWFIGFGVTVHKSTKNIPKSCIFKGCHLANDSSEPKNPNDFLKALNKIFQMHLYILPKLWLIFCCHQQKIQKLFLTF